MAEGGTDISMDQRVAAAWRERVGSLGGVLARLHQRSYEPAAITADVDEDPAPALTPSVPRRSGLLHGRWL